MGDSWSVPPCARSISRFVFFLDAKTSGWVWKYRAGCMAVAAAFELIRYRWGRIGVGPFLFVFIAGLMTLNLHWLPFTNHIPSEGYLLAEALFGSSMLVAVLDDWRLRMRRLTVLNGLTGHDCAGPESCSHDADRAGETEGRGRAKAAWFQLMEGNHLVPTQHAGLSRGISASMLLRQPSRDRMDMRSPRARRRRHASRCGRKPGRR